MSIIPLVGGMGYTLDGSEANRQKQCLRSGAKFTIVGFGVKMTSFRLSS
jgi:hypothetical protein